MNRPYRTAGEPVRPRVDFGRRRAALNAILAGAALIAFTVGLIVLWATGGPAGIRGSVLVPAVLGAALILRASWGTIVLRRDRDVLSIHRRGIWGRVREVPLAQLQSVQAVPASLGWNKTDYVLDLTLSDGRTVRLRRAGTMAELETDRRAIADFLVEHGLLWAGRAPGRPTHARVATNDTTTAPETATASEPETDATTEPTARRR